MHKLSPKQGAVMLAAVLSTLVGSRLVTYLRHARVMCVQQYVEDFKTLQHDAQLTIGPKFLKWWDAEVAPGLPAQHNPDLWDMTFSLAVHAYLHEKEQQFFHSLSGMLSSRDYRLNMRMHRDEMDELRNTVSRHGIDPVKLETQFAIA